ncbi:MAG: hypothetical protein RL642_284 [Bacteroidota bacterium]
MFFSKLIRVSPIFIFFFLGFPVFSNAQQKFTFSGQVKDTTENKPMFKANIVLLRAADSILVAATRSDNNGQFILTDLKSGKYLLQVSYPKYADYVEYISLDKDLHLQTVPLVPAFYLLKEIVVKSPSSAIRIKGDTTEFVADSFKVGPNADVQELLRKMPGFQVNAKGEIVAQGEKIKKILVDGEEFFSDDPAVVTKNLRADAIEKVQLFDKKSDQAAFTGIEDGERTKTINLEIKEESKKGFFGKVEGLSNFNQYANGKLMVNAFKGKRKLSSYLTTSNTQFVGLTWEEDRNFNGSGNTVMEMLEDGGMMIMNQQDEEDMDRTGLPNQQLAGAFYGDKLGKLSTSNSGQYQRLRTIAEGQSFTRSLLDGFSIDNNNSSARSQDKKRFKINSTNEWGSDTTGLFKVVVKGRQLLKSSIADYSGESYLNSTSLINKSTRSVSNQEDDKSLVANLSYRKKYSKKGRSFSLTTDLNFNNTKQDGLLNAQNTFFVNELPNRIENIDQQKMASQNKSSINAEAVFTEPLTKKSFMIFRYGFVAGSNDAIRNTFDKNSAGSYVNKVDSLSNHFVFNTMNNNGSISYRFVEKKVNFVMGLGLGRVNYKTNDVEIGQTRSIGFTNFLPTFSFTYKPRQQRNFNLSYNGVPVNPSLQQIQPIIDNTDPLRINIGNSQLVQGFNNRVNFRYSDFKVLKSRSISLYGSFSSTSGAITNSNEVGVDGKTVSKFVNANGIFDYNVDFSYDLDIYKGIHAGFSVSNSFNRFVNLVNGVKNVNDNRVSSISLNLNYWGERWYSFYSSFSVSQNSIKSSIQSAEPIKYLGVNGYGSASLNFKKIKTYIDLNFDARFYGKSAAFAQSQNVLLFSPELRKVLTKDDALEMKVVVFDLFNRNADIKRNITSNFISQDINNTVRRFVLVGLVYNFKNKKAVSAQ